MTNERLRRSRRWRSSPAARRSCFSRITDVTERRRWRWPSGAPRSTCTGCGESRRPAITAAVSFDRGGSCLCVTNIAAPPPTDELGRRPAVTASRVRYFDFPVERGRCLRSRDRLDEAVATAHQSSIDMRGSPGITSRRLREFSEFFAGLRQLRQRRFETRYPNVDHRATALFRHSQAGASPWMVDRRRLARSRHGDSTRRSRRVFAGCPCKRGAVGRPGTAAAAATDPQRAGHPVGPTVGASMVHRNGSARGDHGRRVVSGTGVGPLAAAQPESFRGDTWSAEHRCGANPASGPQRGGNHPGPYQ